MFDQCMGDCFHNQNCYCGGPAFGQWWYDNSYYGPWCSHYPCDNWNWYCNYNNYGEGPHANCHCPNKSPKCNTNHEYKTYERYLSEHYANLGNAKTTEPLRKSLKIDCFTTEKGIRKTQSELFKSSSRCSIKKSAPRRRNCSRNRKNKLGGTSQSTTTFENLLGKLGMQICSNGGTLAYILLESDASKKDEQNCGDSPSVPPATSYSKQPTCELKNQFLDELNRQLNETESLDTSLSTHKRFIKNFNKLYADLGGSLRFGESSAENFEHKTAQMSKQSKAKVKMAKSDKIIKKNKKAVRIEEPAIGNGSTNKVKRSNNKPLANKESKLKKRKQSIEKQCSNEAKLHKEKEEISDIPTHSNMKNKDLSGKSERKRAYNTRKPSEQKRSQAASRKSTIKAGGFGCLPKKAWRI